MRVEGAIAPRRGMNKGQKSGKNKLVGTPAKPARRVFARRERAVHRTYCREYLRGVELEGIAPSNVRPSIAWDIS